MSKLTRRNFLKYASMLGAISSIFKVDLIRDNLDQFTDEQLKKTSKIEDIEEMPVAPYFVTGDRYYRIKLKDGNTIYMWSDEINKQYGSIIDFLETNSDVDNMTIVPANWND